MQRPAMKLMRLFFLIALVMVTIPAWADIPPSPGRPADWNEHPPPLPAPPPEKEEIAAQVVLASAAALAIVLWRRKSARLSGDARQPS